MKFLTLVLLAFALVLGGGCVRPITYTQLTGKAYFNARDHTLYLSAVRFERNAKNEWEQADGGPRDTPDSDSRNAAGFSLQPRYGSNPSDPKPSTFVISKMDVSLNGKLLRNFIALEMTGDPCDCLELFRVPADADFSQKSAPQLKSGTYHIKIHYILDGRDYDAEFELVYSHGLGFERWGIVC